jgi:pyruvate formate lyase activating enzyme
MPGPAGTPPETLVRAAAAGRAAGLRYVYAGNLPGLGSLEDTHCPGCGAMLVERRSFRVLRNQLSAGACPHCGCAIPGIWSAP